MTSLHLTLSWLSSVLVAAPGAPAVGYAQATGYFKKESRPTLYQPLNLLDAREGTAWCSPTSDPLNDQLTFGFTAPVQIDGLIVTTGNGFDQSTWVSFSRARKVALKSGKQTFSVTLEDVREPQTLTVSPPLVGTRFTLEVLDQFVAEDDPDTPVCLSDVVFLSGGKPLNGAWLTARLKYDRHAAPVLGTWFAGYDNTPDHFLTFNYDGTFVYSYEPYDRQLNTPRSVSGTYDAGNGRLTFKVAGKRYGVKMSREGQRLALDGELPEDLKRPWRSHP